MHLRTAAGFTLPEILVTLGVVALLALAVGSFTTNIFRTTRYLTNTLTANEQARRTVGNFVSELRTASISSLGAYPIAEAGATTITFYSDTDADAYKERVRYFVQGTTLKRGFLKPSGNPLTYNSANEVISDAIINLVNTGSVFSYYDSNYDGQTAALSDPPSIPSIRLVRITLQVDANPNEPPGPYELSSQVNVRNLKDNL